MSSSDAQNQLDECIELRIKAGQAGGYSTLSNDFIPGYSMTPGFETYAGMGGSA